MRKLSNELNQMGHKTSHNLVAGLLHEMGYSLQANQKMIEETFHLDRNAQFEHINDKVKEHQVIEQPVVSIPLCKNFYQTASL